jgi:ribonuclease HII
MTNLRKKPLFKKNFYEDQAWLDNRIVCGIDEVGRGCLAGPLVAAAVILPRYKTHRLLKDSKLLTEQEREKAYRWITAHCHYGIGILHPRIIDCYNIWQTTLLGMKKALVHLLVQAPEHPAAILVDAMPLKVEDTGYPTIPVHHFIKGESKSSSIAAASIIAKVSRDRLMRQLETIFPGYSFSSHKGYSTDRHKTALTLQGPTIIHRMSFLSGIEVRGHEHERQHSLC